MADTSALGMEWVNAWLKGATDFWAAMVSPPGGDDRDEKGRLADAVDATRRVFSASVGSMKADPAFVETFAKTLQLMPEISGRLFQHVLGGYMELGRRWSQQAEKMGRTAAKPFDFEHLDKEFLRRWTDVYREELQRYLHIPQLGLARTYQEKLQVLMDAFNLFQTASAEFSQMMLVPVEKAVGVMQRQLADMAEKGQLPQDAKAFYALWVKTLEGHFMTLFRSTAYTETLARAVAAANRFTQARQAVAEDWLRVIPAPTVGDVDELAHDVYQLKKRVRELEATLREAVGGKPLR